MTRKLYSQLLTQDTSGRKRIYIKAFKPSSAATLKRRLIKELVLRRTSLSALRRQANTSLQTLLMRSNAFETARIGNEGFIRLSGNNMVGALISRLLKCVIGTLDDILPRYIRHPLIPGAHTRAYGQNFHRVLVMRDTTCNNRIHQTLRQSPRSVAESFWEQYQKLLAPTAIQTIRGANRFPEVRANNLQCGVGRGASVTFIEAAQIIHSKQGYRIGPAIARGDCIHVADITFQRAEIADLEQWILTGQLRQAAAKFHQLARAISQLALKNSSLHFMISKLCGHKIRLRYQPHKFSLRVIDR